MREISRRSRLRSAAPALASAEAMAAWLLMSEQPEAVLDALFGFAGTVESATTP